MEDDDLDVVGDIESNLGGSGGGANSSDTSALLPLDQAWIT